MYTGRSCCIFATVTDVPENQKHDGYTRNVVPVHVLVFVIYLKCPRFSFIHIKMSNPDSLVHCNMKLSF